MRVTVLLLVLVVIVVVASSEPPSVVLPPARKTTEFGGQCAESSSRRPVRSCWMEGRGLPCVSRRSAMSVQLGDAGCAVTCVRVVDEFRGGGGGGGVSSAVSVGGGMVNAQCAVVDVAAPARLGFCFRVDVYSNCTSVASVGVAYQQSLTSTCCCY